MPPSGPDGWRTLAPSRRIDAVSRLDDDYLAYARSIAHPHSDPEERLAACRHFLCFGMVGEAVDMLGTLMDEPSLRAEVSAVMEHVRGIRRLGAPTAVRLPDMRAEDGAPDDRGYWVVPAGSDTTLIAFCGRAQRLGMSIYFMHSLLGRLKVNVIYLFDWADSYYFAGVNGLGAGIGPTVERLGTLCAELGSRRVLCIGQSAGGYAAIRYGVELDADGVIAFSPVILPVMGERTRKRIAAACGLELSAEEADLRPLIAGARRPPHVEVVYGLENTGDAASARHIADLPQVIEHPLPGVTSHATIQEAVVADTFLPMLERFAAASGPGRWRKAPGSLRHRLRKSLRLLDAARFARSR